jgi:exodeoxyribonuclease-3
MPEPGSLLLSWNVNGVRSVFRKGALKWLEELSPDLLALQETKATAEQLPEELLNPPGYQAEWHWGDRKGYSGVGTFHKRAPLELRRAFDMPGVDAEGRILASVYADFVFFNVYFPNGQRDQARLRYKLDFYEAFLRMLEGCRKVGEDKIIICGDLNTAHRDLDIARPRENEQRSGFLPVERAWIDKLIAQGFIDTFRMFESGGGHYTWWDTFTRARRRNVGWRLDYFFVSENLRPRVRRAFIMPEILGSDHCPVGIELGPA